MYPTPLLSDLQGLFPEYKKTFETNIFWLFWTGIYIDPKDINNVGKHLPLYALIILITFEKLAQKWQMDRFGCTIHKVRKFKILEEEYNTIKKKRNLPEINEPIKEVVPSSDFVTYGEAKEQC